MHPEIICILKQFPGGLWLPKLELDGVNIPTLVVKAPKEFILTAKVKQTFSFYLVEVKFGGKPALGVITAFFDDPESPLALTTPLTSDDAFVEALANLSDEFNVCFFDEHDRELLSYRCHADFSKLRKKVCDFSHIDKKYASQVSYEVTKSFSVRTTEDDKNLTPINFVKELFPSELLICDMSNEIHKYKGSSGFSIATLNREEPGTSQEQDIIFLLQRCYEAEKIIHGPVKVSDGEELVDVAIHGDIYNILLQAKDSPNTEKSINRVLHRKKKTTVSQLLKALSQLGGSISSVRRENPIKLKTKNGHLIPQNLGDKSVVGVIVVRELFDDSYAEYSKLALAAVIKHQIPIVFFDYPEFEIITRRRPSELSLLSLFEKLFMDALKNRAYRRVRFD